jgi:hypothetical protein
MERKAIAGISAITLAVAIAAFEAGRMSSPAAPSTRRLVEHRDFDQAASGRNASRIEERDFSKVTIENIGEVNFDQAYELLRSATPETLTQWSERLDALPTGPQKMAAIATFYKTLAQLDTTTAVDLALKLTRREARWAAFGAVHAAAPASEMRHVARMETSGNLKGLSLTDFVWTWSRIDPVSASELVTALPDTVDNYGRSTLLANWASMDPGAAKTWLDNLDPKQRDDYVYEGFYGGWFEANPAAAVSHLAAHATDEKFDKAVRGAAQALFQESPDAARAFIISLPTALAKGAAGGALESQATGRFLLRDPDPLEPSSAARWLYTLPEDVRDDQIGRVVAQWSARDPDGVNAWLREMPLPTRDRIAAEFCQAFDWRQPGRNLEAGLSISDPRLREEALRALLQQIGSKKSARKMLQEANLPPPEAAKLQELIAEL